jgi:hypothetical protein
VDQRHDTFKKSNTKTRSNRWFDRPENRQHDVSRCSSFVECRARLSLRHSTRAPPSADLAISSPRGEETPPAALNEAVVPFYLPLLTRAMLPPPVGQSMRHPCAPDLVSDGACWTSLPERCAYPPSHRAPPNFPDPKRAIGVLPGWAIHPS